MRCWAGQAGSFGMSLFLDTISPHPEMVLVCGDLTETTTHQLEKPNRSYSEIFLNNSYVGSYTASEGEGVLHASSFTKPDFLIQTLHLEYVYINVCIDFVGVT